MPLLCCICNLPIEERPIAAAHLGCASKNIEAIANSTQQLKAEIAALANEVEAGIIISECYIKNIINRLRQLSAV
jgi:hypothetical protein